ncbi:hypothetical protein pb186bvf_015149 [Paramecium bursaria]
MLQELNMNRLKKLSKSSLKYVNINSKSNQIVSYQWIISQIATSKANVKLEKKENKEHLNLQSLRGGGCINSQQKNGGLSQSDEKLKTEGEDIFLYLDQPKGFAENLIKNAEIINKKSYTILDGEEQIKKSIQYFYRHEWFIQKMVITNHYITSLVDILEKIVPDLLESVQRLIKSNTLLCTQILYIVSLLNRILFTYQLQKKSRFMEQSKQQKLIKILDNIDIQLSVENQQNPFRNQIDYELFVIRSLFTFTNTDSIEGKEIAQKLFLGILSAASQFPLISSNDQINQALQEGIVYLIRRKIKADLLEKYKIIYTIETFKWQYYRLLYDVFQQKQSFDKSIAILVQFYQANEINKCWETMYCWIRMISQIVSFQLIIPQQYIDSQVQNDQTQLGQLMIAGLLKPISNKFQQLNITKYTSKNGNNYIIQASEGFDKLILLFQELIDGESHLPKIDQYQLKFFGEKQEEQKKTQFSGFVENLLLDFQISQQRIQQFDIFRLLTRFINSCVFTVGDAWPETQQVLDFYFPQQQQLIKILNLVEIQLYFYQHSLIFHDESLFIQSEHAAYRAKSVAKTQIENGLNLYDKLQKILVIIQQIIQISEYEQKLQIYEEYKQLMVDLGKELQDQLAVLNLKADDKEIAKKELKLIQKIKKQNPTLNIEQDLFYTVQVKNVIVPLLEVIKFLELQINSLISQYNILRQQSSESMIQVLAIIGQINKFFKRLESQLKILDQFQNQFISTCMDKSYYKYLELDEKTKVYNDYKQVPVHKLVLMFETMIDRLDSEILNKCQILTEEIKELLLLKNDYSRTMFDRWMKQIQNRNHLLGDILANKELFDDGKYTKIIKDIIDQNMKNLKLVNERIDDVPYDEEWFRQKNQQEEKLFENSKDQVIVNRNQLQKTQQYFVMLYQDINNKIKKQGLISRYLKIVPKQDVQDEIQNKDRDIQMEVDKIFIMEREVTSEIYGKINEMKKSGQDYIQLLCLQVQQSFQQEIIQFDMELDKSFLKQESAVIQLFKGSEWRIKQCILSSLLLMDASCWSELIQQKLDYFILKFKVFETDKRVTQLLDNQQYKDSLNEMVTKVWSTQQDKIEEQLQEDIKKLNQLQNSISNQTDVEQKHILYQEYNEKQHKIQEQLKNVENIGAILGVTVMFIQDIKKDLMRLESKLDEIRDNINTINVDLQYLKGKTVFQMLEIRKNKILHQGKIIDSKSIYIPLFVKEKHYETNQEDEQTPLFTEQTVSNAEINEFIWGTHQKDSLLIHGLAGCGKSTSARKVEEFLWRFNQTQLQQKIQITPLIPIVISLPSLQDPSHQALEETLKQDGYRFDNKQIDELKQAIEEGKFRLVIIMDSYDEIKSQYQINLIKSNKLSKWRCEDDIGQYPKIITTTRTEVLTSQEYYKQFISESENLKLYKEIRLIRFDQKQIQIYIDEYCKQNLKLLLLDNYKQIIKKLSQNEQFLQFENLWIQILSITSQNNDLFLVDQEMADKIIRIIKQDKNVVNFSNEKQRSLSIELQEIWAPKSYIRYIQSLDIMHFLETVFMMEIVAQVFPIMIRKQLQLEVLQTNFNKNFQEQAQAKQVWSAIAESNQFLRRMNFSYTEEELEKVLKDHVKFNEQVDVQQISKALLKQNFTTYDFYQSFFEFYIKKQISKLIDIHYDNDLLLKESWRFATELAIIMTNNVQSIVEYPQKGLLYERDPIWQDQFFDDSTLKGELKRLYRKCIPIKQKFSSYQFNHKSQQEFLVARDFINMLEQVGDNQEAISSVIKNHNCNQKVWNNEFMIGIINFVAVRIKANDSLLSQYITVMKYIQAEEIAIQNFNIIQKKLKQMK